MSLRLTGEYHDSIEAKELGMNPKIDDLVARIRSLEEEIESELHHRRLLWQTEFERGKIHFQHEILEQQRRFKTGLLNYLLSTPLSKMLTAPIIYSCIVPLLLLDVFLTIYQYTCFPVYGIARVRRQDYLVFDRAHLAYLNIIEKFHCAYCSYGNGLISYAKEIISRTEQYFCPIKHAQRIVDAHQRYNNFTDFGDAEAFRQELSKLREELARLDDQGH
jgi:hypothetical protein